MTGVQCVFCSGDSGTALLWRDEFCRILRVDEPEYPGFLRVVLNRHVCEMTDLEPGARERLMRHVFAAESAVRELFRPDKVNLASLGNRVPHLHWHVIGRSREDPRFPDSVWSAPRREPGFSATRSVPDGAVASRLAALLGAGDDLDEAELGR